MRDFTDPPEMSLRDYIVLRTEGKNRFMNLRSLWTCLDVIEHKGDRGFYIQEHFLVKYDL